MMNSGMNCGMNYQAAADMADDRKYTQSVRRDRFPSPVAPAAGKIGYMNENGIFVEIMGGSIPQAVPQAVSDIDPVVGWLVAINGSEEGRDYRIHSGTNFLGRGENMSISVKGDNTISRDNHLKLTYDEVTRKFFVVPGDCRNPIYVNGNILLTVGELRENDMIEVGRTKLLFRPLCNEAFDWSMNHNQ